MHSLDSQVAFHPTTGFKKLAPFGVSFHSFLPNFRFVLPKRYLFLVIWEKGTVSSFFPKWHYWQADFCSYRLYQGRDVGFPSQRLVQVFSKSHNGHLHCKPRVPLRCNSFDCHQNTNTRWKTPDHFPKTLCL